MYFGPLFNYPMAPLGTPEFWFGIPGNHPQLRWILRGKHPVKAVDNSAPLVDSENLIHALKVSAPGSR
ncbi:MAG: hypothetical protein ACI9F9_000871 [Candidatus Paceibacteria bacterium]|jgi:hypothetical protein